MSKHFMRGPKGKALVSTNDGGLYVHYRETCEVNSDPENGGDLLSQFGSLSQDVRVVPSSKGWVVVMYEKRGFITFYVQLSEKRAAWQRIQWEENFENLWNHDQVKEAVTNFLWVAECEEQKKVLPR